MLGRTVAETRASLRSFVRVRKESRAVMDGGVSVNAAIEPTASVKISDGGHGRACMFVFMSACLAAMVGSRYVRWQERRRVQKSSWNFLEPGEAGHSWEPCGRMGSGLVQMTGEELCGLWGFLAKTWR